MPKIISAFTGTDPLGSKLAELGASMFGGNTTDNALKNEQLYALQRQNTETDNYAKLVADGGIMPTANNKLAQAMILAAGLDPQKSAVLGRMDAATSFGADDPRTANWQIAAGDPYSSTAGAFNSTLAEQTRNNNLQSTDRLAIADKDAAMKRWLNENISAEATQKSNDTRRAHDQQSVDRNYAVDQSQLTERTKPFSVYDPLTKKFDFLPTNEVNASDMQPIVSEADQKGTLLGQNWGNLDKLMPEQRQVLGANPSADRIGTPRNYILPGGQTIITYDGITSAKDGTALPPNGYLGTVEGSATDTGVTKAVTTDLQRNEIANKKFNLLIDEGMALTSDPTLFGAQGQVRSMLQEASQAVQGVSALFKDGADGDMALREARTVMQQKGMQDLLPELYDPNLPKVDTIWGLLVFQGATALAGQDASRISDKDVNAMKAILGSPQSMFSSAEAMKSKLETAKSLVDKFSAINQNALGNGVTPGAQTPQPVTEGVTKSGNKFRVLD